MNDSYLKKIVISMSSEWVPGRTLSGPRYSLESSYCTWVIEKGGLPFPIPNTLMGEDIFFQWLDTISPDGIIFTGAGDINDMCDRNVVEGKLFSYAINNGVPLLGICRGMQQIANFHNVSLTRIANHVGTIH